MKWKYPPHGTIRYVKYFAWFPTYIKEDESTVWLQYYYEKQRLYIYTHIDNEPWWQPIGTFVVKPEPTESEKLL
jgi:hypothetical protein